MIRVVAVLIVLGWLFLATPVNGKPTDEKTKDESKATVYTNADLPPSPPTTAAPPAPQPVPAPEAVVPPAALSAQLSYSDYRDKNGHGEGWWRHQAAELDLAIIEARYQAESLHVAYVRGKSLTDATLPARSREATLLLKQLEAEREEFYGKLGQAGGLPGWLRRGDRIELPEPLPSPVLGEATQADQLTLAWKPVSGAPFYLVEVQCLDCCGLLGPCEVQTLDVSRTSAQFPFEAGGSGRWRVRALDPNGFGGEWSTWRDLGR